MVLGNLMAFSSCTRQLVVYTVYTLVFFLMDRELPGEKMKSRPFCISKPWHNAWEIVSVQ